VIPSMNTPYRMSVQTHRSTTPSYPSLSVLLLRSGPRTGATGLPRGCLAGAPAKPANLLPCMCIEKPLCTERSRADWSLAATGVFTLAMLWIPSVPRWTDQYSAVLQLEAKTPRVKMSPDLLCKASLG